MYYSQNRIYSDFDFPVQAQGLKIGCSLKEVEFFG